MAAQLGDDTLVLRTSLDRGSLRLSVVDLPDDAHRLAWLSERFDELPGSGIVYCLTVDQAETTARWLRDEGHDAAAYTGSVEPDDRLRLEEALRANKLKALVATSALGMGFDKGDLAFCVHLGLPPSPVAYYQQIGPRRPLVGHRRGDRVASPNRGRCDLALVRVGLAPLRGGSAAAPSISSISSSRHRSPSSNTPSTWAATGSAP